MALRHALIGLLATEPSSGYDLTRRFAETMSQVWPAGHGQIYPELARLSAEGLIEETETGPRGRRTYAATAAGVSSLRGWLLSTEPDYGCRSDADLRGFFLWAIPPDDAVRHLERDAEVYRGRRAELVTISETVDWGVSTQTRMLRLALERGLRYYAMQIDWAEWAVIEITADRDSAAATTTKRRTNESSPVPRVRRT